KNLLRVEAETDSGDTGEGMRLGMLMGIRAYALEQLHAAGEEAEARRRHAAWYFAFAESVRPHLTGPNQVVWLDRLDREFENLRAAFHWSQEQARAGDEDAAEQGFTAASAL